MAITMKDVRAWLDPEEVNYEAAKQLGPEAIPFLMELVQGADLGLASKATYLASLIKTAHSSTVLEAAAARNEPVLRVAAASAMRNLPEMEAEKVLDRLKDDPDVGIRKTVVKSAERFRSLQVEAKLQQMAEKDPEPLIRELAGKTVQTIKRRRQAP